MREHRALHRTHALLKLDLRNAFNCTERRYFVDVLLSLPPALRVLAALALLLYGRDTSLSFFAEGGARFVVHGCTGTTQGCTVAMLYFALAFQDALVEALTRFPSVTAYSDADDCSLLGPPADIMSAARFLVSSVLPRLGLSLSEAVVLPPIGGLGEVPRPGLLAWQRRFGDLPGLRLVGDGGLRVVGAPVGTPEYVRTVFLHAVVDSHRQRLARVSSLGARDAQVAKLLLLYCCVPRMFFVLTLVPLDMARESLTRARADLLAAWGEVVGVSPADLAADPDVAAQVSLPHRWGGQGLVDHADLADAAFLGCWAAHAAWLRSTVPTMAGLGAGDAPGGWGFLPSVLGRLRARGGTVATLLLPSLADYLGQQSFRLQRALTQAVQADAFTALHQRLVGAGRLASATRLLSLSSAGALAWHRTVPYADSLVLPTHLVRLACRWELGLPLPRLLDAVRENRLCACCGLPVTDATGHHFLTTSQPRETQQTFGGYYDTHQAVLWALASSLREAGFVVALHGLSGLLPPGAGQGSLLPDLNVRRLREGVAGVLGDVTVVHPLTGHGVPTVAAAAQRRSAAADAAERRKVVKYGDRPVAAGYAFCPLALETYGAMGPAFFAFLKEAAGRAVSLRAPDTDSLRFDETDAAVNGDDDPLLAEGPEDRRASRLFVRWCQRLSLARVFAVTQRLFGACVDSHFTPPLRASVAPGDE